MCRLTLASSLLFLVLPIAQCDDYKALPAHVEAPEVQLQACADKWSAPPNLFNKPLKLQWNSWPTSQLATAVAGILMREKLGMDVRLIPTKNSDMYNIVATGAVHAAFEVWSYGRENSFQRYASFDAKQAMEHGRGARAFNSSVVARIGLFESCSREKSGISAKLRRCIDSDILETLPMLSDVLKTQQGQDHFAFNGEGYPNVAKSGRVYTPPQCGKDTNANCSAQVLHIAPEYNAGLIEGVIDALKLPVRVRYLGESGHRNALWTAYTRRLGGLFYYYFPCIPPQGIRFEDLPRAAIDMKFDPSNRPLQKLAWAHLNSISGLDASTFVENFALGDAEYSALITDYQMTRDVQVAACRWVKNNQETWAPWIQFPQRTASTWLEVCSVHYKSSTTPCDISCAVFILGQLIVGCLLLIATCSIHRTTGLMPPAEELKPRIREKIAKATGADDEEQTKAWPQERRMTTPLPVQYLPFEIASSETTNPSELAAPLAGMKHRIASNKSVRNMLQTIEKKNPDYSSRIQFVGSYLKAPVSIRHMRSFDRFCRPNSDQMLERPHSYPEVCWSGGTSRRSLYAYFFLSGALLVLLLRCVAYALLSSGFASVIFLQVRIETYRVDNSAYMSNGKGVGSIIEEISLRADVFTKFTGVFKFFPSFLLLGYVTYAVNRWRSFLEIGFSIQGRIHDVSLMVGGAIVDPSSEECKRLSFNVYRFLTLVHMLVYKSKHPWLDAMDLEDFVSLGLVTHEELAVLSPAKNKLRDTAVAWLSREIQLGLSRGLLHPSCAVTCLDQLSRLRGFMAAFHDRFQLNEPNLWAALMQGVVDTLIFVFVSGSPFAMFVYQLGCWQYYVFAFTLFLVVPWTCCLAMISIIHNPYAAEHDFFNVDSLIGSSEQVAFHNLRIAFDYPVDAGRLTRGEKSSLSQAA